MPLSIRRVEGPGGHTDRPCTSTGPVLLQQRFENGWQLARVELERLNPAVLGFDRLQTELEKTDQGRMLTDQIAPQQCALLPVDD